jgi:defect-in-organelle-trafficking protein DotA
VFADAPDYPNSTIPAGDLSMHYLGDLFGNVPSVLSGTGSDMLGHLFYALNQGILVVAGVWLTYTIFNMLLTAGLEGTIHSPQKKTTMVLFRIAVGLCLLIPSSTTGYSAIQDLMMKVVVEGINLADETWSYALNYMQDGGMLYTTPNVSGVQPGDVTPYMKRSPSLTGTTNSGPIQNIFDNEVCMFLSNHYNADRQYSNPKTNPSANTPYDLVFVPPSQNGSKITAGRIDFPGYNNQPASSGTYNDLPHYNCGSAVAVSVGTGLKLTQYQQAYVALEQMAMDLKPLAKIAAEKVVGQNDNSIQSLGESSVSSALMDYFSGIRPYARYQQDRASAGDAAFISTASSEGWFGAGSFYWDLARLNDSMNKAVSLQSYTPVVNNTYNVPSGGEGLPNITTAMNIADGYLGTATSGIWQKALQNIAQQEATGGAGDNPTAHDIGHPWYDFFAKPTAVDNSYDTGGVDFASIIQDALGGVVNTVSDIETSPSQNAFYDPLDFVQRIGRSCLSAAGEIWAKSIAWIIGFAAVAGICASMNPGSTILNAMINWLAPLWQASAAALFAAGFMLTFYAPLYPYLLFLFGAMGWLIYVIEAMVAAPLVSFGMTHPEGSDFLGRAEQSLMLALGVFLRPVLMVVGFLSAMMLSYIGFAVVNFSLGNVLTESFGLTSGHQTVLTGIWTVVNGSPSNGQGDHFTGHDLSDFLLIPLLMVAYGLVIIEVVNQAFSLIHVLPDMVLRWIGVPVQQDMTERYAGQIQSGMSGAAKQGADTAGKGATGFASFMGSQVVQPATEVATSAAMQGMGEGFQGGGSGGGEGGGAGGGEMEEAAMLLV